MARPKYIFENLQKNTNGSLNKKSNDLRFESHLAEIIIGSFCPEVVRGGDYEWLLSWNLGTL